MTGMALQWRTASANAVATFVRQPHYGRAASRATVRVHASFLNPHSVLGVSPTADVKEVKRAYRKLALQYHPDVCKSEEGHERFIALTQAYEMLLGRAEGKADTNYASSSGWDFHDWYWNFRMQRSWEKQQRHAKKAAAAAAAAADSGGGGGDPTDEDHDGSPAEAGCGRRPPPHAHAGYKQPEARENLRSQLAGLRHRAAVRANRPAAASPAPAATTQTTANKSSQAAWSAASGCSLDAEEAGTQGMSSASPSASGPWSWSWSWDETLDSEAEDSDADAGPAAAAAAAAFADDIARGCSAGSAAELHDQYTHVYEAAEGGGGAGASPAMAVQDGHLGTVVANHAVPFPGVALSSTSSSSSAAAAEDRQQSTSPLSPPQQHSYPAHGSSSSPFSSSSFQQNRAEYELLDLHEPEPFSNPFDRPPPGRGCGQGQAQQQQRRRFAADSASRESVSHQLAGLRRKAAMKAGGQA